MSWFAKALAALALAAMSFAAAPAAAERAVFAGGCFWCMEEAFEQIPGVSSVVSGYTGGHVDNPSYRQVTSGSTGHYEAIEVQYDPGRVSYAELLEHFWRNIDPFDSIGQFCDKGSQYLTAIFYADSEEEALARQTKAEVQARFGQSVATEILPQETFYEAEGVHQNYYLTNSGRYKLYKFGCGRPQRLEQLWG